MAEYFFVKVSKGILSTATLFVGYVYGYCKMGRKGKKGTFQ